MKEPVDDMVRVTLQFSTSPTQYVYVGIRVRPNYWAWTGTRRKKIDGPWSRMSNFIGSNHATVVDSQTLVAIPATSAHLPEGGSSPT